MDFIKLYNKIFGTADVNELLTAAVVAAVIFAGFKIMSVMVIKGSDFFTARVFNAKTENGKKALHDSIVKPAAMWFTVTGVFFAVKYIPFSAEVSAVFYPLLLKAYRISLIIIVCLGLVSLVSNLLILSPKIAENADKSAYSFFSKLTKVVIVCVAVIAFLTELNFDVSGLIASLGIGGVVLALAAQDTASNFFSGVVILFDKPFEIGDWISVADMEGVVEEMNFRSCRIRTFDNALISVPNSKLSSDSVTNWAKMELRKAKITFTVTYDTKRDALQKICDEIKSALMSYEEVKADTVHVYFDKFSTSGLDVVVQYNSYLTSFGQHVLLKEKVQYMVMETVEQHNCRFALDSKMIHIEN